MLTLLFFIKIRKITLFFRIKSIKSTMHDIDKYVLISIYIFIVKNNIKVLYRIYKKNYFIDNLKTHILLNNNIINFKKIVLNIVQNKAYINNYKIIIIIINR